MVSVTWVLISFCSGLLCFISISLLAPMAHDDLQTTIARYYSKSSMRAFGRVTIIWRSLGGPELKPLRVDDAERQARVVMSSGALSDDEELPFEDIDNRVHRLHNKPLAVVPEDVPVAVDAEISEVGHWMDRKGSLEGFGEEDGVADPWLPMSNELRAAHPLDALHVAPNSVKPENIESAKQMTKARFAQYGGSIGAVEAGATVISFAAGAGVMAGLRYVQTEVIGGGGGGGTSVTLPGELLVSIPEHVMALGGVPL